MKRGYAIVLIILLLGTNLTGCGNAVSNEVINIQKYKGLVVEDVTDSDSVWQALLEHCTVEEYPKEELEMLKEELDIQYGYIANKTAEQVIRENYDMTLDDFAKEQLKKQYAITLIAEKEGLLADDKAYEEELKKRAESNGFTDTQEYEDMYGKEELSTMMLEERVLQFLIDNVKQ